MGHSPGANTVLVVESDPLVQGQLTGWLEEAGFEVRRCPGPHAPEYTCPAGFLVPCPLAASADVIVLDLWLESDTVMFGTPASEVLLYYLSLDKPVVALTDGTEALVPAPQEGVVVLRRPPDRRSLLGAVRSLLPLSIDRAQEMTTGSMASP
jgi:CheY-like chemotaxis protein